MGLPTEKDNAGAPAEGVLDFDPTVDERSGAHSSRVGSGISRASASLTQQPELDQIEVVPIMTRSGDTDTDERRPLLAADTEPKVVVINNNIEKNSAPGDKYNFIYLVFFSLGLSTLLPWNFFISLNGFWDYKFRNTTAQIPYLNFIHIPTDDPPTELSQQFTSYLAIASNVPNALFVILNAIYGQKFSLNQRVSFALIGINVMFVVITIMSRVNTDTWQIAFLGVILFLVVLVNVCGAIYQGAVLGAAAKFPSKYMAAAMAGQSVGGIFPVVVDIIVTSIGIPNKDVGFICFLIATTVLVTNLLIFYVSSKTAYFKFYIREEPIEQAARNDEESIVDFETVNSQGGSVLSRVSHATRRSWQYCAAIFISFAVTLSVFPALTVNVDSQFKGHGGFKGSRWADVYFQLVGNFLLFNTGDLCGRTLAGIVKLPGRSDLGKTAVLVMSLLRLVFVPAFLMCRVMPLERSWPVAFPHDSEFIVIMTLFAISNGYVCSICFCHGPAGADTSQEQEEIALILTACLVSGIAVGSGLSYPILKLV